MSRLSAPTPRRSHRAEPQAFLRSRGRRVLWGALAVSLVLHLGTALLWVAPRRDHVLPPDPDVRRFLKRPLIPRRALMRRAPSRPIARPLARQVGSRSAPAAAVAPAPLSTARRGLQGERIPIVEGVTPPGELPMLPLSHWPAPQVALRQRAGAVAGRRWGVEEVQLAAEMLGVDALDTGRHRALVVVDPGDAQKLSGFLYLSSVYSESMERAELGSGIGRRHPHGTVAAGQRRLAERETLEGLADKMTERTGVQTQVLDGLSLDDPRLQQVPFLLLTALCDFPFSDAEAANLGRYMLGRGFLYAEVVVLPLMSPAGHGRGSEAYDVLALRGFIRSALRAVGLREDVDWAFARLSLEHPLFHSYYDIGSLPRGFYDIPYWYLNAGATESYTPGYLEEIRLQGRTVGVYSRKAYADFWAGQAEATREADRATNFIGTFDIGGEELPAYDLGINILVYALTREGSLAQKLVAVE